MCISAILTFLLSPVLVSSMITSLDSINCNNGSIVRHTYYVLSNNSFPGFLQHNSGNPYIEADVSLRRLTNQPDAYADMEILIVPADDSLVGYQDGNETVVCCDGKAISMNRCVLSNRLIFNGNKSDSVLYKQFTFVGVNEEVHVHYNVPKEGKYYLYFGSCDPSSHNIKVSGNTTVVSSVGHLPGRSYGLLPFSRILLFGYCILFVVWSFRCFAYRKELMSVHIIIFFLDLFLVIDTILRIANLNAYNSSGIYGNFISFISVIFTTATSTLSRCLAIVLMLGLGVARPNLGAETWHVLAMGVSFFAVMLWDNYCKTFHPNAELSVMRGLAVSVVDGYIFYFILQSLMSTITELETMKQTSKLEVFKKLRVLYIIVIVTSGLYSLFFGYLIYVNAVEIMWKWTWFFSSAIWSLITISLLTVVMYLWTPNERSLAYAYHVQVSTEESETYNLPEVELQSNAKGKVEVATIDDSSVLKPMGM